MAGAADDDLWTYLKRNSQPLPRVTGPLVLPDDVGTLRLAPLPPATGGPLAPYAHTPPAPTADSIRKDWMEADTFAKSHVSYSPQAKTGESRTQATYGATENLLRDLYLNKKAQAGAGTSAERMFANSEFADLKATRAWIGPSPQLSATDPDTGQRVEHGALTIPYQTGPWMFINPDHPQVSDNAGKYGLIAGMNYAPLHELGHAVPGFRHARYADRALLEAQVNSDGAAFAEEVGAPYPSDLQLVGRGGTMSTWPLGVGESAMWKEAFRSIGRAAGGACVFALCLALPAPKAAAADQQPLTPTDRARGCAVIAEAWPALRQMLSSDPKARVELAQEPAEQDVVPSYENGPPSVRDEISIRAAWFNFSGDTGHGPIPSGVAPKERLLAQWRRTIDANSMTCPTFAGRRLAEVTDEKKSLPANAPVVTAFLSVPIVSADGQGAVLFAITFKEGVGGGSMVVHLTKSRDAWRVAGQAGFPVPLH